ncbi:hypothetical protein N7510_001779 [Penicillium lagena]|uniref:uncharacterized protein n=1 Tax=Penicillium lagena TaxID=94218 RepID=UPI002542198B|nr:uncharacterized protein N7510_001779 [Penicillium lagena]KAJ5625470.1 hypothetical protein N7510_001779 [Penicillium lagena]
MSSRSGSLLRRVVEAALDREEKGYPPVSQHEPTTQNGNQPGPKSFAPPTTNSDALIPPYDKLLVFRSLTGIDSVPALTQGGHLPRPADNVGIYTRVVTNETNAGRGYRMFSWMINTCLGIQIVVAAAVTALGAASGPHTAVTAFGAINTILAGILTYLRGSGLPDRLKQYQNRWKNIREYIEQREREFCLEGCDLDVQEEIFIVESMYQSVKDEMEASKSSQSKQQQPDDPRIRRSLLPTHGGRTSATPARRSDILNTQPGEGHVSPLSVPEPVLTGAGKAQS